MKPSTATNKDAILCVTPAAVQEYERLTGLTGICEILERKGLIRIIPEKKEGTI